MRTRYSKSVAQQCKFYEVENIFDYMVSVYINGSINQFRALYKELKPEAKKEFIEYCFDEISPEYWREIIIQTI